MPVPLRDQDRSRWDHAAIGGAERPNLVAYLATTTTALGRIGEAVHEQYLESGPAPRPLALAGREVF